MLFVKNLVFLDGAITRLAPDLDLLGQIAEVSLYFATTHGDRIMADVGVDPRTIEVDLDGARAAMGITDGSGTITHRELRDRRQAIRETMSQRRRSRRSRQRRGPRRAPGPALRSSPHAPRRRPLHRRLRRPADRPPAPRHPAGHGEGRRLRGRPRRRRRVQAAQLDERPQPVSSGRRRRAGVWTVRSPKGETLTITMDEVLSDSVPRAGRRPRPAEGRRRGPPAGAAGRQLRRHRARAPAGAAGVPHRHRAGRPAVPRRRRRRRGHRGQAPGRDRRRRAAGPLPRVPASATRCCARCAGVFVAQQIKPQAKVLASERDIAWVEVDYDALRGIEPDDLRLF